MPLSRVTKRKRGLLYSHALLWISLLVAIVLAIGFARAYFKEYASIREIRQLEQEAKRLETEKISLLELLQYVQTDAYVEEEARAKLQYKKPGEEVVYFTGTGNVPVSPVVAQKKHNLERWWDYFFGR